MAEEKTVDRLGVKNTTDIKRRGELLSK